MVVGSYIAYLGISIVMTIWVARTLSRNGKLFLVNTFHGDERIADAVNQLLVVGFYLINIGFITRALQYGAKPGDLQQAVEIVSSKVGLVLLVLGGMHFLNMYVFARIGRSRREHLGPRRAEDLATV